MASGSLDQPLAKLKRAADYYRTIKYDFFGGYDRHTWAGILERHRDGLEYRVRAGEIEPLPPELPLIFGDAYHNLRAALDYLVYQMHVRRYRGRFPQPPPDIAQQSAFPILRTQPAQPASAWREIKNLAQRQRTAIEWLQPYKTRGGKPVRDLRRTLLDIGALNNIDKHRELHLARNILLAVETPRFAPDFGFRQNPAFGVTLETDAYVDTWAFTKAPPAEQMDIEPTFCAAIGIEPGGDKIEAITHLGGSVLAVREVINRFSHLFPPPAEPLDLSWVRFDEMPW